MPKRGAIAVLLTTAALALLLSFRTPSEPVLATRGGVAVADPSAPTSSGEPLITPSGGSLTAPSGEPAASPPGATASPATSGEPAVTTSPTAGPAAASEAPAGASGYADGTLDGAVVTTRWGPVQVRVTISGGEITDVTALQMPARDHHSAEISDHVAPVLRSAVLAAQSAEIDIVSGATYTSLAYARSLQAALDAAGA